MILALTGAPLIIVSIIAFILIIGIIIVVHEGGHFFFARRAGVLCHEFSIGMGPVIFKKQFGETTFCLRAIPIGGFVSMAGEELSTDLLKVGDNIGLNFEGDLVSEIILDKNREALVSGEVVEYDLYGIDGKELFITLNTGINNQYFKVKKDAFYVFEKDKKLQITPYDRCFESKSIWNRFLALFAGPFMNMVLAIVLYLIISFATGVPNYKSNVIGEISSGYPADSVLMANDQIISVSDGKSTYSVNSWNEFSDALDNKIYTTSATKLTIKVLRNNEPMEFEIDTLINIVPIGISNFSTPEIKIPDGINGVMLGKVAIRYKDSKNEGNIKSGDILTKMYYNGTSKDLSSWNEIIDVFKNEIHTATDITFDYYSYNEETKEYTFVSKDDCAVIENYTDEVLENQRIEKIQRKIGVSPTTHFSFFECIGAAFKNFWNDFTLIFRTLKLLIAPSDVRQIGVSDLSSFVGIFGMVKTYIGAGLLAILSFTALLSVNIGVMNLLPIPALDGGRLVFLLYELVTRKKPSRKVENIINNIFFILLIILFVFVTYNDIIRLFKN